MALLLALMFGVIWTWLWALRRLWFGIPLLSGLTVLPARETPWELSSIMLAVFLYLVVNMAVFTGYETITGRRLPRREAAEQVQARAHRDPEAPIREVHGNAEERKDQEGEKSEAADEPKPAQADGNGNAQAESELMLQSAIVNLILGLLVPSVILKLSNARLCDLGWDTRDWHFQVFQGVRAALLITPVVFAVQNLAVKIWDYQRHLLDKMVTKQFTLGIGLLAIVSAMFLAPLVEEMLFRGLLQKWLEKNFRDRSQPGELATEAYSNVHEDRPLSIVEKGESPEQVVDASGFSSLDEVEGMRELSPETRSNLNAIFVSSALFAGMHYMQWPAPIAIFVLSLWLGTIYARSRSLLTVIALHATFNSISTTVLLLDAVGRKMGGVEPKGILGLFGWFWP